MKEVQQNIEWQNQTPISNEQQQNATNSWKSLFERAMDKIQQLWRSVAWDKTAQAEWRWINWRWQQYAQEKMRNVAPTVQDNIDKRNAALRNAAQ